MTVSREEFDMLARRVEANSTAVSSGAALAVQVAEIIKDVSDLRSDLREHRQEHKEEARSRQSARRWALGIAVTGLGGVGGLYGWVALLLHR